MVELGDVRVVVGESGVMVRMGMGFARGRVRGVFVAVVIVVGVEVLVR
jgi:hypothetical protein